VSRWPKAIAPAAAAQEAEFTPAIDRTVEASLNRPLSREGLDVPPFEPDRSLLARLAQGWSAPGLVGVGGMLIVAGLMWSPTATNRGVRPTR
jgi:hypothetical protein